MITRRPPTESETAELVRARDLAVEEAARDATRARWAGNLLIGVGLLAGLIIGVATGFQPWWAMLVPLAGLGAPAGAAVVIWRSALDEERRVAEPYQRELGRGLDELSVEVEGATVVETLTDRVWILTTPDGVLAVLPSRLGLAGAPPSHLRVVHGPHSGWTAALGSGEVEAAVVRVDVGVGDVLGSAGLGWMEPAAEGDDPWGLLARRLSTARAVWAALPAPTGT